MNKIVLDYIRKEKEDPISDFWHVMKVGFWLWLAGTIFFLGLMSI